MALRQLAAPRRRTTWLAARDGHHPTDDRPRSASGGGPRSTRPPGSGVRPLIVVGFDGSEGAARAIAAATTLMAGAEALVVCVYQPIVVDGAGLLGAPAEMVRGGSRALDAEQRAEAEQIAERGAALAAAGGCASQALALAATGAVWAAINHLGEQHQAAALVVGARGLSGVSRLVLGSVSSGLVHHATRPVLVVRHAHAVRGSDSEITAPGRMLPGLLDCQVPPV